MLRNLFYKMMFRIFCILLLICPLVAVYAVSYDDDTELDFIWEAATGPVHHYNVYASTDGDEYVLVGTTDTTSYILIGEYEHRYRLKVQAVDAAGNGGPMSEESDLVICRLTPPWDLNDDGVVNMFDIVTVGNSFGETGGGLPADINYDGKVDIFDLVLIGSHFGEKKAAPSMRNKSLLQQIYNTLKKVPNPTLNLKLALIELEKLLVPDKTRLFQNYPNPFNPETWIPFQLAEKATVSISVYDISGKIVRILELGERPAGVYVSQNRATHWDGLNDDGEKVSSGVYFYHLRAGDFSAIRRMIILK